MINYVFFPIGRRKAPIPGVGQLFRIMKLTSLLLIVFCMHLSGSTRSQTVSLDAKNQPLSDVLRAIKKQTDLAVVYNDRFVNPDRKVSIHVENASLTNTLESLLKPLSLTYHITENTIVIAVDRNKNTNESLDPDRLLEMQQRTIIGTVTNEEGDPLEGVTISIKGAPGGTTTDESGHYQLPLDLGEVTLVFSMLGYEPNEQRVADRHTVNVSLRMIVSDLEEVVVTALGFEIGADKTATSASKISDKEISISGEVGLLNKIAGKASGVYIGKSSGSDPGGGSFVQIRGQNTLSGDHQPLYIIDGVPMNSSIIGGTSERGVIQQSRVNDINPDDIASIQVLKSASASALWGSRAANGVVMITTKKGAYNEKMKISFKSTYSLDEVNLYHQRQTTFGQGENGVFDPNSGSGWGDKIANRKGGEDEVDQSGPYFVGYQTGNSYYPILTKNSRRTYEREQFDLLFRNGHFFENSLNINGGNATSNYLFSASDINQHGVIRNSSDYRRSTIRINVGSKLNDVINLSASGTYSKISSNRVQRSNNTAGMMLGYYRMPTDFDITDYKGSYYSSPTAAPSVNRHRSYRNYLGSSDNPVYNNTLWTMYEQLNPNDVNRFIGKVELGIKPVKWFELIARTGIDNYSDHRETYFPKSSAGFLDGRYVEEEIAESQVNLDVIGKSSYAFRDYHASLIVGFNVNDRKQRSLSGAMTNFLVADGPMNFSNAQTVNTSSVNSKTNRRSGRLYSVLSLEAYNAVFANFSFAGETASTFGELSDKTFYYPSADIAWQFTTLPLLQNSPVLSFGKLRFAYGEVGVEPQPYRTETLFVAGNSLYGNGAYLQSTNRGNALLRPERKKEYEIGADLRFFNNRLSTGVTYYKNTISDLLLSVPVPLSTGFATEYQNIGSMKNNGLEVDVNYRLIDKADLRAAVSANFSRNRNRVTDLAGTSRVFVGGVGTFMAQYAVEGEPVGIHMGGHYLRDDQGNILFDGNGFPRVVNTDGKIGDPNPDWRGGMGLEVSYKNFAINMAFEMSRGGDFYDGTRSVMYTHGTHTDVGREVITVQDLKNFRGDIIPAGTTVRGNVMDLGAGPVLLDESYYTTQGGGFGALKEQFVVDGSWARLRDVSLSYMLQTASLQKATKLHAVVFSLSGRNLFLWTKLRGVDPDTNQTQASMGRGMDYFENPGTRSYFFSIQLNF